MTPQLTSQTAASQSTPSTSTAADSIETPENSSIATTSTSSGRSTMMTLRSSSRTETQPPSGQPSSPPTTSSCQPGPSKRPQALIHISSSEGEPNTSPPQLKKVKSEITEEGPSSSVVQSNNAAPPRPLNGQKLPNINTLLQKAHLVISKIQQQQQQPPAIPQPEIKTIKLDLSREERAAKRKLYNIRQMRRIIRNARHSSFYYGQLMREVHRWKNDYPTILSEPCFAHLEDLFKHMVEYAKKRRLEAALAAEAASESMTNGGDVPPPPPRKPKTLCLVELERALHRDLNGGSCPGPGCSSAKAGEPSSDSSDQEEAEKKIEYTRQVREEDAAAEAETSETSKVVASLDGGGGEGETVENCTTAERRTMESTKRCLAKIANSQIHFVNHLYESDSE